MPEVTAAAVLRTELQYGTSALLRRRRGIVGLSVFSSAVLGGIALFQVGILKHLPDPPLPRFDADAVNGSAEAYSLLRTPDALLGMASYAATACLAASGGEARWEQSPWIPISMGVKAAADAAMAARLSLLQITKLHKFSVWSLLVSAATFSTLTLALPETRRALLDKRNMPRNIRSMA